jgi:hypothetical protein
VPCLSAPLRRFESCPLAPACHNTTQHNPPLPALLQTLSNQDIFQFLIISVLAGLFWLQTGQDDTVLG